MLLRLLEENRPVDLILYCDTGLEFPQMYDHLNRLEDYIDREITWLKAPHNFEYYFFEHRPKLQKSGTGSIRWYELAGTDQSLVYGNA